MKTTRCLKINTYPGPAMDTATNKSIQWIATEIDDLSLYLRVHRLDRVADMLDEAQDALQATLSDSLTLRDKPLAGIARSVNTAAI